MSRSVFTQIIDREIAAEIVFEDQQCIVINDRNPQAPFHVLVIPKKPLRSLLDATAEDKQLLGHLNWVAAHVAQRAGHQHFRLIANNGADAGQTVFHLHFHVLANTQLNEQGL